MRLVGMVYEETRSFPREEMFGLTSQMRRASVSVPCNIAEGQGRATKKDFGHFLAMARGSMLELQTQIQIAADLQLLSASKASLLFGRTEELLRMLSSLMKSLA
jgi:four helix bundle protein